VHPDLDAQVLDALAQVEFEPGMNDGKVVKVRMTQPVRFQISSGE
jgi:outer membrane biosynthesis protein TonB